MTRKPILIAVVGQESMENLLLSNTLRQLEKPEYVHRFLVLRHLIEFIETHADHPIVVYLDIFSFESVDVTQSIQYIRDKYSRVVFNLFIDKEIYDRREQYYPAEWVVRFNHYFKIFKPSEDAAFEPILQRSLRISQQEAEYNHQYEPIRRSSSTAYSKGIVVSEPPDTKTPVSEQLAFISYSRRDWNDFVETFVEKITSEGYSVWIDQEYLIGGEDWLDAIADALDRCTVLLLVMSPDSLESRFVKMEYRYFFNYEKPIIPISYRPTHMPPELLTTQYIDFSSSNTQQSYKELFQVLYSYLVSI